MLTRPNYSPFLLIPLIVDDFIKKIKNFMCDNPESLV